jgi:hypothetical protein
VVKFDITKLNPRSKRVVHFDESQQPAIDAVRLEEGPEGEEEEEEEEECPDPAEVRACVLRENSGVPEATERGAGGFGSTDVKRQRTEDD